MIKCAYYKYEDHIIKIGYDESITSISVVSELESGETSSLSDRTFNQIVEYLEGERKVFDFPITLTGTAFQKKVWEALIKIPYGETRTYKDIALEIGSPNACRAVGGANNKNPILIAVPCHRVIGKSGDLVGFAGGIELKKLLLELEKNNK